jgi:putative transcriptional regulator
LQTIRELRQASGWTQFELALKVGVQPQAIYLWETGRRTPQVPQLRKLGQVFGLCSDEIALVSAVEANEAHETSRSKRRSGEAIADRDQLGMITAGGSHAHATRREHE